MKDLSSILESTATIRAIYDHWKKAGDSGPLRKYLGASIIGHPCERYLWYAFRYCCCPEFDGRMYRLFDRGNLEEPRVVADLRAIGCTVHEVNKDGEQFGVTAFGGHFRGHLDGCVLGVLEAPKTWHVLEVKTHSAKNYAKLVKNGVQAFPKHYAQAMIYMHLTGMKRTLYIGVNKDTEELHAKRIRYDKKEAELLMKRAKHVITSTSPPDRLSDRPDYYRCKWCDARDICFGSLPPDPVLNVPVLSCRQCCHATPVLDGTEGEWVCEKHHTSLKDLAQVGCINDHLCLPGLFATQEVLYAGKDAAGNDYLTFKDKHYGEWRHGKGKGRIYSSAELRELPLPLLNNGMISTAKEKFDAKVDDGPEDILNRYPASEANLVWEGKVDDIVSAWQARYKENIFSLTPIARCSFPTHSAVEYADNRMTVAWAQGRKAEIWEK